MKKFVGRLLLAAVLSVVFYQYLTSAVMDYPLGLGHLFTLMAIGSGISLLLLGACEQIGPAYHELMMWRRRRKWHKDLRRRPSSAMGITTALL